MAQMMRCVMAHWQGNDLVPAGTVVDPASGTVVFAPVGATMGLVVSLIDGYFEPFESGEPTPRKRAASK